MKISIITLFPKMVSGFFEESIVKKAIEKKLIEIEIINLRDFAIDSYGAVDDRPYGGGAGMILRIEPLYKALEEVKSQKLKVKITSKNSKVILTSPKGKIFNQTRAKEYSKLDHLVIIAGHYEAVDERINDYIDEELSLGDFVLTGGEIVAAAITDAVARLVPGVLKKEEATQIESFFEVSIDRLIEVVDANQTLQKLKEKNLKTVQLLEFPQYTRPEIFNNQSVPEVLLSGNHKEIENWRLKKAYEETLKKRPDLLDNC